MEKKTIVKLICCLLLVFCLTGCGASSKDDRKEYHIAIQKIDGVDVKTYISSGQDQVIVSVTNKSGKMIGSGYIEISYYDEKNNKITVYDTDDVRYNMFENGKEIVYGFELPVKDGLNYYIPARTEVKVTMDLEYQKNYSSIIERYVEEFSYSHSATKEKLTVFLKNNSSEKQFVPRTVTAVFYKNNRPVYVKEVYMGWSLDGGQTNSKEVDIPSDYRKSEEQQQEVLIDYDNIKIFRILDGMS